MEIISHSRGIDRTSLKISWDGVLTLVEDGYPFFECDLGIKINQTMVNDEEENIMVSEDIPIQHGENLVNIEIE